MVLVKRGKASTRHFSKKVDESNDKVTTVATPPTVESLPDVNDWPHRPIFVQAAEDADTWLLSPTTSSSINIDIEPQQQLNGNGNHQPVPLGVPVEFESPLFKGKILIRIRSVPSKEDPESHHTYFAGKKRVKQVVIQGQFKEALKMSDVYFGDVYDKPLNPAPPPFLGRAIKNILRRICPGIIVDLVSSKPRVLELLAGGSQSLSIDPPGSEPDLRATIEELPENTAVLYGEDYPSIPDRKKRLSTPKNAQEHYFDTDHVFTFHCYDDIMDLGSYRLNLPFFGSFNLAKTLDGQPISISAVTKDGRFLFRFRVWHEQLLSTTAAA